MRLAARIAINRTIAGLHFPVDSAAGQLLGLSLAEYLVNLCTAGTTYDYWTFDGAAYPPGLDFDGRAQFDTTTQKRTAQTYASKNASAQRASTSASLGWLWYKAYAEWA
jgi:hypothetical protein